MSKRDLILKGGTCHKGLIWLCLQYDLFFLIIMRIAFIVNNFPCLSQTFILNQITGLIEQGHEVDIFANDPGSDSKVHSDVKKYDLLSKTYYFNVPPIRMRRIFGSIKLLLSNHRKHSDVLSSTLNSFIFRKNVISSQWMIPYWAIPILEQPPYDIIHCHFGECGLKGAQLKLLGLFKGRLVTTFHGYDLTTYLQAYNQKLSNRLFKRKHVYQKLFEVGDVFLPISERWKQQLIHLGCDETKILVHRMGIDLKTFTFTPRCLSSEKNIRIITTARLVEKKGVEYGIRAIAKLISMNQGNDYNIEYYIVGDGPLKGELQRLIDELEVHPQVQLLGWKQQHELVDLLNSSHILLAPSVTSKNGDQEGIPVVLMEAMAMGLPVVSTQHSGIPELVEDGISGYLVPERDADALANKLHHLVNHPDLWTEMGMAGHNCIEAHYNINYLNKRLVDIYHTA